MIGKQYTTKTDIQQQVLTKYYFFEIASLPIQIPSQDRWGRRLFCFRKRRHGCRSARIGTRMCHWAERKQKNVFWAQGPE